MNREEQTRKDLEMFIRCIKIFQADGYSPGQTIAALLSGSIALAETLELDIVKLMESLLELQKHNPIEEIKDKAKVTVH